MNIEKRVLNTIWSKSGTGSLTTKISIPINWLYDMGLSVENKTIIAAYDYDNKKITIETVIDK